DPLRLRDLSPSPSSARRLPHRRDVRGASRGFKRDDRSGHERAQAAGFGAGPASSAGHCHSDPVSPRGPGAGYATRRRCCHPTSREDWLRSVRRSAPPCGLEVHTADSHVWRVRSFTIVCAYVKPLRTCSVRATESALSNWNVDRLGRHGHRLRQGRPGGRRSARRSSAPLSTVHPRSPNSSPATPTSPQYLKTVPLGRFAQRSDVAKCVLFLASDEPAYVTGHTIVIDGGQTLGIPGSLEDAAG